MDPMYRSHRSTSRATSRALCMTLAVALGVALAACSKKDDNAAVQTPPASTPATTPAPASTPVAALRITEVDLGRSIGSDKHISNKSDSFGVRDTIYLSVITEGAAPSAKVSARWMYRDNQVVKQQTETIAPTGGTAATSFRLDKASAWPKGKYKVIVSLDGAAVQTKEFEVK